MNTSLADLSDLFEAAILYPDIDAKERLDALIGLDDHKARLTKMLALLVNAQKLSQWISTHHPKATQLENLILRRPPLVILAGDVGSGKSELAGSIGDAVARQEGIDVTLLPLSLSSRGQGRVGEMTQLISSVFRHSVSEAKKLKADKGGSRGAVILLVDEADALAQSRESLQMHHEDKAGVNAFIRGIDLMAREKLPAAVIMCTNRLDALDPAIKRRAADILAFHRPDEKQRFSVLSTVLSPLEFSESQIEALVRVTGPCENGGFGFTYSDLTQKLVPAIVLDAYPGKAVAPERALHVARGISPTPRFHEEKS